MSTPEYQQGEQRSSVKITENSKGEPAVDIKVYTHDAGPELDQARERAVEIYKATRAEVRITTGGAS